MATDLKRVVSNLTLLSRKVSEHGLTNGASRCDLKGGEGPGLGASYLDKSPSRNEHPKNAFSRLLAQISGHGIGNSNMCSLLESGKLPEPA
mmetsp:Transcript_10873/g.32710  ORF Transcript_10873/g.32710 Transcript_10873/m.32710 type:complete len:91 (+) Transcript_10873:507-779(+)